jgi:hypothetical protein
MMPPKTTAGPICFWLSRFLSGVGACFDLVGLVKGYLHGSREMYGRGSYADQVWKACDVLLGFSPVGCTSIRIAATLGYEYHLSCNSNHVDNLIELMECCLINKLCSCFNLITCIATFVWLNLDLPCLKFN